MNTIKIFDIDGTLLNTSAKIYCDGEVILQSEIGKYKSMGKTIDYRDFEDKEFVRKSLDESHKLPLFHLIKKFHASFKKVILTARPQEGEIERWFIRNKILGHIYAVNDKESRASLYEGMECWKMWDTAQRKAKIIEFYCNKYDLVEFYDDEIENLINAQYLNKKNLILWLVKPDGSIIYFMGE